MSRVAACDGAVAARGVLGRVPVVAEALAELERVVVDEYLAVERFFVSKPERLLGHVTVWDPAIGRMNLVQALRVAVHDDRHHYTAVRRALGR